MNVRDSVLVGLIPVNEKDKVTLTFEDGSQKDISINSLTIYNRGGIGNIISKRKKIVRITKFIKSKIN